MPRRVTRLPNRFNQGVVDKEAATCLRKNVDHVIVQFEDGKERSIVDLSEIGLDREDGASISSFSELQGGDDVVALWPPTNRRYSALVIAVNTSEPEKRKKPQGKQTGGPSKKQKTNDAVEGLQETSKQKSKDLKAAQKEAASARVKAAKDMARRLFQAPVTVHAALPARSSNPPPARSSNPPPARSSNPPPVRSSNPPPARSSNPPAHSSNPPPARSSNPPPARSSNPPPARSSNPPPARSSNPPPRSPTPPPPRSPTPPPRSPTPPPRSPTPPPPRSPTPPPPRSPTPPPPSVVLTPLTQHPSSQPTQHDSFAPQHASTNNSLPTPFPFQPAAPSTPFTPTLPSSLPSLANYFPSPLFTPSAPSPTLVHTPLLRRPYTGHSFTADLLTHCDACSEKDLRILSLEQEVQKLTAELACLKNHQNPPSIAHHYKPATGLQIEKCEFRILSADMACPPGYITLAEGHPLVVPTAWFTTVRAKTNKKDGGFLVKAMISGMFQPTDVGDVGGICTFHGWQKIVIEAVRVFAVRELRMTPKAFNEASNQKLSTMRRGLRARILKRAAQDPSI